MDPCRAQQTFYKHGWTREDIYTLLEGLDGDFSGVVSFHLWSHLWWSRRRRDFSSFHAGRLTERRVRRLDTTYNVVARRFLPPPMNMLVRLAGNARELLRRNA